MPVGRLVRQIADKAQVCTQRSWTRPYGVGLLVAGHDKSGAKLFYSCPSGNFYEYKAMAIGSRSQVSNQCCHCAALQICVYAGLHHRVGIACSQGQQTRLRALPSGQPLMSAKRSVWHPRVQPFWLHRWLLLYNWPLQQPELHGHGHWVLRPGQHSLLHVGAVEFMVSIAVRAAVAARGSLSWVNNLDDC